MKEALFKTLVVYLLLSGIVLNLGVAFSTFHIYVIGN